MKKENYEEFFIFRLTKILYFLTLSAGILIVLGAVYAEWPVSKTDYTKSTINCDNQKSYSFLNAKIEYGLEVGEALSSEDDYKVRFLCENGTFIPTVNPSRGGQAPAKNYEINYVKYYSGDWRIVVLYGFIGLIVVYTGTNVARETLLYLFLGKSFDWLWFKNVWEALNKNDNTQ